MYIIIVNDCIDMIFPLFAVCEALSKGKTDLSISAD